MDWLVKRGEICLVDFEPVLGSEANKQRPAIIISNNSANSAAETFGRGVVTVVPLTSNTTRVLPFQVLLWRRETGLSRDSKAQAEQIRAVDIGRIGSVIGRVSGVRMAELEQALRLHLSL